MSKRISLYIDADNISHTYAEKIVDESKKIGILISAKVYGDFTMKQHEKWNKNSIG